VTAPAPRSAQQAGKRLWRSVLANFDLDEHELVLLRQAVHIADLCDQLQAILETDGPMVAGKAHPAAVELRQQRITLARLIVALRVPLGAEDTEAPQRLQTRATRGVYGLGRSA
jgi:hypothetical protein